jgi:hypothetical protein
VRRRGAKGGDYLLTVKDNQPTLRADIAALFADPASPRRTAAATDGHGGRVETRRLCASDALNAYLGADPGWPHLGQVCRLERTVTRRGRARRDVAYAITSLTPARATPAQLLGLWRGHWGIENRLHWVRDVTFDEDRCQVRTGSAPQVLAALRNTVIGLLRRDGRGNIAAALRRCAARPDEALALVGIERADTKQAGREQDSLN